jgi:hypothetical protein
MQTIAPLQFVSVLIPSIQLGTTTNEKGYFELAAEISGAFDIVFSYIGYEKLTLFYHAEKENESQFKYSC